MTLVIALLVLVSAIPVPLRSSAQGVIWLPEDALLRAGDSGLFQQWLVAPGTFVHRGTPVLAIEDPLLAAELAVDRAKVEEAEARYRAQQTDDPAKAQIAGRQLEQARFVLGQTQDRYDKLIVSSRMDGVLVAPTPQDMPGRFYKKGELLGYVLQHHEFIARVVVDQSNIDLVRTRPNGIRIRMLDNVARVFPVKLLRAMPEGIEDLPTAALGSRGGGRISVDPKDSAGTKALQRIFVFDLALPPEAAPTAFGERIEVRFDHGYEPLLQQAYRRVRQVFLRRFNV